MMFGYDTRLSMTNEEEDAEIVDIEEKLEKNAELLGRLQVTEQNDLLSNKVLGVEERILDLQDRREEIRFNARERELEDDDDSSNE